MLFTSTSKIVFIWPCYWIFLLKKKTKSQRTSKTQICPFVSKTSPFPSWFRNRLLFFYLLSNRLPNDPIPRARRRQASHAALFRLSPTGQDRIPQALPPPALDRWSARFAVAFAYPLPLFGGDRKGPFFSGGCRF